MTSKFSKVAFALAFVAVLAVSFVAFAPTGIAQTSTTGGSTTSPACSFTRNLTIGSVGADVLCLQQYLNADGHTVSTSGAGSVGNETTYFGPLTRAAVISWQNANKAQVLSPVGLSAGTGFWGPSSRAHYIAIGGAPAGTTTPTTSEELCPNGNTVTSNCMTAPGSTTTVELCPNGNTVASNCATAPGTTTTGNSVMLSGPASSTLIDSQSQATLANFVVSANGTITAVALKRIGVSADASLSSVYLYDGNTRLTDGASVSSGSVINFTGLNIAVSGSRILSVKADMAATAGETVGVQLTSVTMSGVTLSGLPVSGNLHSVATATLALVNFSGATAVGASDPGAGLNVWEGTATVSTRDVIFSRLALRQIGSINSSDINNFRLWADGTEVASSMNLDSNGYVTFSGFSKTLTTGARILKVTADVVGGSGRTVQMSLRGSYDVMFTDSQYGASRASTATGSFPFGAAAWTVNNGTMTVVKTTGSASENVTRGATDVSLATYTFTAYGERIKVETLRVGVLGTTTGTITDVTLQNVRLMVNGTQVGSTTAVPAAASFAAASGTSFTTNFFVEPGTPVTVEIRGDMVDSEDNGADNDDIAAGTMTAVQAVLVGGAATSNAIPQVSLGTINVPSQANVLGNTLTIAVGSLTLSQESNYGAQTIVAPQTAYKLGSFNLIGNSTEAVNVNTFEIDFTGTGAFDASDDLTDVYIVYNGVTSAVKGTVTDADNTWSQSFTLAQNQTVPVVVYATIGSSIGTGTMRVDLTVTGVTVDSATTVYADVTSTNTVKDAGFQGQVITGGTSSITASVDASRPNATLVDDSGTVVSSAYKFDAVNESFTITDLTVTLADATTVQNVILMDGATTLSTKAAGGTVTFNGLNVSVPANGNKVLTVNLQMGTVGVGAGSTGASLLTTLTSHTTRTSSGTVATTAVSLAGQAMYAYKAIPTITNVALPNSTLVGGGATHTLAKFTVGTNGTGTIGWNRFIFTITKTITGGSDTLTGATLWDVTSGATQVAGTATPGGGIEAAADTAGTMTFVPSVEQQVSGAKTYELRAAIGGSPVVGNSVTTQIAQPSAFAASTTASVSNTASSVAYTDLDVSTTVTAGDIRKTAQDQYTTADVTAAAAVVGHNAALKIQQAYSTGTAGNGNMTLTLAEFTTDNVIAAATFTVTGAGSTGVTCTPFTGTAGTGAVTTEVTTFDAIQSVVCSGTDFALRIHGLTVTNDSGAGTGDPGLSIVITKGTDYAVDSTVAAGNSDLSLALTGGVAAAASFVWSDLSAASHSITTADWTNGFLVKNLPTDTQNLLK